MQNLIDAVHTANQNNNELAALFIALNIPDICAAMEYPGMKVRSRYIKWLENFCQDKGSFEQLEDIYKLRSKLMRQGISKQDSQSMNRYSLHAGITSQIQKASYISDAQGQQLIKLYVPEVTKTILVAYEKYAQSTQTKLDNTIEIQQ